MVAGALTQLHWHSLQGGSPTTGAGWIPQFRHFLGLTSLIGWGGLSHLALSGSVGNIQ
jgi:hypothetical protein